MKVTAFGNRLKEQREKNGLTQTQVAEWLNVSTDFVSGMENGVEKPSFMQFTTLMQKLSLTKYDYYGLFADDKELQAQQTMEKLRRCIADGDKSSAGEIIKDAEGKAPFDSGMYLQYLSYFKVLIDGTKDYVADIQKLTEAILITKKKFSIEKIHDYRLCHCEIYILNELANCYDMLGKHDTALKILFALKENIENHYSDERAKVEIYPKVIINLSNYLINAGIYEGVEEMCRDAKNIVIRNNRFDVLPLLLFLIAQVKFHKGELEECRQSICNAFYLSRSIGSYDLAEIIEAKAKEEYGINTDI